jgi:hypothetical protein
MTDQIERSVREALSYQDAQLDPDSIDRLRAVDYHPRRRRIRRLPTIGLLGTTGTAAAIALVVSLSSGAAPAFAGWQATPTTSASAPPAPGANSCGGPGLGTLVLTDSRGPYTAAIYSQGSTSAADTSTICLSGDSIFMSSRSSSTVPVTVGAGQLLFAGGTTRDSAGDQLTLADGRAGSDVSAVTLDLSDGTQVQATVSNGWYMAWWPGATTATTAEVTTPSGTTAISVPTPPTAPACPQGARCTAGYSQSGSESGGASQTLNSESQSMQSQSSGS